jgi:hypothetical protein
VARILDSTDREDARREIAAHDLGLNGRDPEPGVDETSTREGRPADRREADALRGSIVPRDTSKGSGFEEHAEPVAEGCADLGRAGRAASAEAGRWEREAGDGVARAAHR